MKRLIARVFFEPTERLQATFIRRGVQTPLARWLRTYSYSHWCLGALLINTPIVLVGSVFFDALSGGRSPLTWTVFGLAMFVVLNLWLMSYNHWRIANERP